eukprot:GHVP01052594.1.p1 GENE.GHVP01052594.1~~GHVP01052594.1.p1  ORF type:complete len:939 (+),score=188.81 GHVP01052594.1:162-2978(+)
MDALKELAVSHSLNLKFVICLTGLPEETEEFPLKTHVVNLLQEVGVNVESGKIFETPKAKESAVVLLQNSNDVEVCLTKIKKKLFDGSVVNCSNFVTWTYVVVSGLPEAPEASAHKLCILATKYFQGAGHTIPFRDLFVPTIKKESATICPGIVVMRLQSEEEAKKIIQDLDGTENKGRLLTLSKLEEWQKDSNNIDLKNVENQFPEKMEPIQEKCFKLPGDIIYDAKKTTRSPAYVIVSNLPKVPEEKALKLGALVATECKRAGHKIPKDKIVIPITTESGSKISSGVAIIETESDKQAEVIQKDVNGAKVASVTFDVALWDKWKRDIKFLNDLEKFDQLFVDSKESLYAWMIEHPLFDQITTLAYPEQVKLGEKNTPKVEVMELSSTGKASKLDNVKFPHELEGPHFQWSPSGSILLMFYTLGLKIVMENQEPKRISMPNPSIALFDNEESLLCTYCRDTGYISVMCLINLFEVIAVQGIPSLRPDIPVPVAFSPLGRYLAVVVSINAINIYDCMCGSLHETIDFGTERDATIVLAWSGKHPVLAVYRTVYGEDATSSSFLLRNVATKSDLRSFRSAGVYRAELAWHNDGLKCALLLHLNSRKSKKTKKKSVLFGVAELKRNDLSALIPCDLTSIEAEAGAMFWHPIQPIVALLTTGETGGKNCTANSVRFLSYTLSVGNKAKDVNLKKIMGVDVEEAVKLSSQFAKMEVKPTTNVFTWSSFKYYFALGSQIPPDVTGAYLSFGQINSDFQPELANTIELKFSAAKWSPNGAFLLSSFVEESRTRYRPILSTSFTVFDLAGDVCASRTFSNRLQSVEWRPRGNFLSFEEIENAYQISPEQIKQYKEEDKERAQKAATESSGKIAALEQKFKDKLEKMNKALKNDELYNQWLADLLAHTNTKNFRTVIVEEVIEETVTTPNEEELALMNEKGILTNA